jgi:AcrR family transcriptional regulator
MSAAGQRYHHGALRSAVISAAVSEIEAHGTAGLSIREVARRADVSHAAPMHHFGDKAGLFTAIAAEGFRRLSAVLDATDRERGDLEDVCVAYSQFATENRGFFAVMFGRGLCRSNDADLTSARASTLAALDRCANRSTTELDAGAQADVTLATWSFAHGIASLALSRCLGESDISEREWINRLVSSALAVLRPAATGKTPPEAAAAR